LNFQEEDKRQEATAHHFLYEIHTLLDITNLRWAALDIPEAKPYLVVGRYQCWESKASLGHTSTDEIILIYFDIRMSRQPPFVGPFPISLAEPQHFHWSFGIAEAGRQLRGPGRWAMPTVGMRACCNKSKHWGMLQARIGGTSDLIWSDMMWYVESEVQWLHPSCRNWRGPSFWLSIETFW